MFVYSKKPIETEKLQTHQAYCYRYFFKCSECDMVIDKKSFSEHDQEYHLKVI